MTLMAVRAPGSMSQVIDRQVVEELMAAGQHGGLLDLIRTFREDGPDHVESVLKGLEVQDLSRVHQGALSLRGMAGNLGAQKLQRVCERLCAASRCHEWHDVRGLAANLKVRFEEAFEALERLLELYR